MKVRQDLPSIPSDRYSRKFIEVCDKYRDMYKKLIEEIDFIHDPEISYAKKKQPDDKYPHTPDKFFTIPTNSDLYSKARTKAYHYADNNKKSACRVLVKQEPLKTIPGEFRCALGTIFINEKTMAIYVPTYISDIRLRFGTYGWSIVIPINIFEYRETEDLLNEEKTIPVSKNLGGLLREARSHDQVPLDYQEEEKNIQGQIYRRIQLFHPWCSFVGHHLIFTEPCIVYVERILMVDEKARRVAHIDNVRLIDGPSPYLIYFDTVTRTYTIYDSGGNKLKSDQVVPVDTNLFLREKPLPTDINLINDLSLLGDLKTEPYVIT